jgi:transposase
MAHARRKVFEVFESTKSPIAEEALRRIQAIYAIEADINGKSIEQRLAARRARSKPLLDAFHAWAMVQRRRFSGKAPLGKALQNSLSRYVEDGRLSIDNNLAERLLRGIAVTRNNFLYVGSDCGGDRAACIFTIVESAKLNGLNPEAYLATVLDRMAHGHANNWLTELLPWNIQPDLNLTAAARSARLRRSSPKQPLALRQTLVGEHHGLRLAGPITDHPFTMKAPQRF